MSIAKTPDRQIRDRPLLRNVSDHAVQAVTELFWDDLTLAELVGADIAVVGDGRRLQPDQLADA